MSQREIIDELCSRKGWRSINGTQRHCVSNGLLSSADNLVVIAPTATGKTGIAELANLQMLKQSRRVAYLVPMAALITSKVNDFSYLDSDYVIYPSEDGKTKLADANVVISTFESFYQTALRRPDLLSRFSLIVVDEFHVLYDKLRGYNLEKVLTLLKESTARIICLSATFEDRNDVSEWLNARLVHISESERKVQINHAPLDLTLVEDKNRGLFEFLERTNKPPVIIFNNRRDSTESRAGLFASYITREVNSRESVTNEIAEAVGRNTFTSQEKKLINCLIKGTGFHHAGLSPKLKELVEFYFSNLKINYLFATTTLAYGMNFPTKTVVLNDLEWWNFEHKRNDPIPVHTYLQMAGRAGRGAAFSNEGYSYVVAKTPDHLSGPIQRFMVAELDEAQSNISFDDYFRKTILELIYAGRTGTQDIINFFQNTYFHFLSEKYPNQFIKYDLTETIRPHVQYLHKNGFIILIGSSGFKLTDLGEVVIEFLFSSYIVYPLDQFIVLNAYLENTGYVKHDFDLIYQMFKFFPTLNTSKNRGRGVSEINEFYIKNYSKRNSRQVKAEEYSAYAMYHGWMENFDDVTIEERFKVAPAPLTPNSQELFKLLTVYESLARKKLCPIPEEFIELKRRIYHGVTAEELPFKMARGIGRETCRSLKDYCRSVLTGPDFGYSGTILEILNQFYEDQGKEELVNIMINYVTDIGRHRAELILEAVENYRLTLS